MAYLNNGARRRAQGPSIVFELGVAVVPLPRSTAHRRWIKHIALDPRRLRRR